MKNNITKIIFVMCICLASCTENKPDEVTEPVQQNQAKPDTTKPVKQTSQKPKTAPVNYALLNSKNHA